MRWILSRSFIATTVGSSQYTEHRTQESRPLSSLRRGSESSTSGMGSTRSASSLRLRSGQAGQVSLTINGRSPGSIVAMGRGFGQRGHTRETPQAGAKSVQCNQGLSPHVDIPVWLLVW